MKILIWEAYGEVDVFDISTPEKSLAVINDIIACLEHWGFDNTIARCEKMIDEDGDNMKTLYRVISILTNAIQPHCSIDSFERLYITELK